MLLIICGLFVSAGDLPLRAQTWTPISFLNCQAVACSGDGRVLYALVGDNDVLAVSTNGGTDWIYPLPGGVGESPATDVSCSADGRKVVAGSLADVSTNYGANFIQGTNDASGIWSANGNMLVVGGNGLFITTNDETTWARPLKAGGLEYTAVSADGRVIVAASQALLFVSTNFGVAWPAGLPATNAEWRSVACTADGSRIIASTVSADVPTRLYVSNDSGKTWIDEVPISFPQIYGNISNDVFISLTSSADGSLLVANTLSDIYISRDFGATWIYDNASSDAPVACSTDGTLLFASIGGYVETQNLPPPLAIASSASQLTLSWPAPSSQYTLQQISDLSSTNWLHVTNAITVTNYRNQVLLAPPASGNAFYRLQGPNP
jgi:photosystem II stability/assembly factor-like uncharacterized protein